MKKTIILIIGLLTLGAFFYIQFAGNDGVKHSASTFGKKLAPVSQVVSNSNKDPVLDHGDSHVTKVEDFFAKRPDWKSSKADGDRSWLMDAGFKADKELFKALLDKGADPNFRSKDGMTPLMDSIMGDCLECVQELLERGVDVSATNKRGESSLVLSVGGGHAEISKLLLEKGADPNIMFNGREYTLLMDAAFEGNLELVSSLLDHGAEIDHVDIEGKTALIYAAKEGFLEVVQALVDRGADASKVDRFKQKAVDYARQYGHTEIVSLLSR